MPKFADILKDTLTREHAFGAAAAKDGDEYGVGVFIRNGGETQCLFVPEFDAARFIREVLAGYPRSAEVMRKAAAKIGAFRKRHVQ
jgi:hypothetical protein